MESKLSNEKQLESNIFQVDKSKKKGFKAFLNINLLPQVFTCIKSELSPLENSCLNEYELQNHIIELCFIPNKITKFRTIKELILQEIRNNKKFWIKNSDVYSEINEKLEKIANLEISEKFPENIKNSLGIQEGNSAIKHADLEGIDTYLQYIANISNLKRKYRYIKQKDGNYEENENKIQKKIEILENFIDKTSNNLNKPDKNINNHDKNINNHDNICENHDKNINNFPQDSFTNQEIYEKFLQLNDSQRLTRHQKKRLYDDSNCIMNNSNTSQDMSSYLCQKSQFLHKKKEEELMKSIFMPNRFLKYPKIEFQAFPYIFRFFKRNSQRKFNEEEEFLFQNFLFFLLLQEKQERKKFRINQNLFSENGPGSKEEILKKNDENSIQEEGILAEFYTFCHNEGFLVENVFFTDNQLKIKQKVLMTNVLILGRLYLQKKAEKSQIHPLESEFLYKEILENLEDYEKLDVTIYDKLIDFFLIEIEQKKAINERNLETLHQFLYLNVNFLKKNDNVIGSFSSIEKITEALASYEEIINSPTMKKKRAYKFHSEERGEWTENIYRRFLEGLTKYYDNSINNKKIAKFIGNGISANHVKFVKGKYMRKLKKRSRDLKIMTKDLLSQDITNFEMKTFDFINQKERKV